MTGQTYPVPISVAVPTFGRDQVLLDTLGHLLDLQPTAGEILVIDQTLDHDPDCGRRLADLNESGQIRLINLPQPSITRAMNTALVEAQYPLLLFLDDDIVPSVGLINAHADTFNDPDIWAVTGQVLQPGDRPTDVKYDGLQTGIEAFLSFPFNSTMAQYTENVMAGNLSVRREKALSIGGFDENFKGSAYRFETEFAKRLCRSGGRIQYHPAASIHHLRASSGGTRMHGHHLTSASPAHGVGDYYYALNQGSSGEAARYLFKRALREVCTRFHLRHPWWIPVKLTGELRAVIWAIQLERDGPRLITSDQCALRP